MAILTKARLTAVTEGKLGTRIFSEVLNEARLESRTTATTTIFLSHSHDDLDKDYVKRAVVLLRKAGVRVYIDSNDTSMPPFTSAQTALKIKEQIRANKKFILLATNLAVASRWCNWELGYGDAHKYIDHLSIIPLAENSGSWNGNEYLRVYAHMEESNLSNEYYKVIYPDGTEMSVTEWLKK
jgi:hypothetical protein